MFERIAYVSRAAPGVGAREVFDIIRAAHNRNGALGLTGALVVLDGHFLQVLEGEPFRVDACFRRIAADPRHVALELRARRQHEQRLFPGEWMALRQQAQIEPGLLQRWGYEAGLPATRFDADRLEAFMLACCGLAETA